MGELFNINQNLCNQIFEISFDLEFPKLTKKHILFFKTTYTWGNRISIQTNDRSILPGYFWIKVNSNLVSVAGLCAFILTKTRSSLLSLHTQYPQRKFSWSVPVKGLVRLIDHHFISVGHLLPSPLNSPSVVLPHKTHENQFLCSFLQ